MNKIDFVARYVALYGKDEELLLVRIKEDPSYKQLNSFEKAYLQDQLEVMLLKYS